ncbi:MAG: T9SS type A sorting domain-containing protein, partial [Bacteroidales bacterium]|nr:T9SS type A sorting domain-containing protein [Bacteroidales bacterium]
SDNEMNCIDYWFGAGLWVDTYSNIVQIRNNHFTNNGGTEVTIWSLGGAIAIYTVSDKEVLIDKNIMWENYSQIGGGLWTYNTYNCTITNNVFFFNSAEESGGALYFREYKGKSENPIVLIKTNANTTANFLKGDEIYYPAIINNTFFGNNAETGGAIYSDHESEVPVVFNSVFQNNNANVGKDIYHSGDTSLVLAYSCIDTAHINTPWIGVNNINVNPGLIDDSAHISSNSSCIEAGAISITYFGQTFFCPEDDIDGQPRPLNLTADIGVDEVLITNNQYQNEVSGLQLRSYPNPFSSNTTIEYRLPEPGFVSLKVFDITGNLIETLFSGNQPDGLNKIEWNADDLNTGQYFILISNNNHSMVQKIQKLK